MRDEWIVFGNGSVGRPGDMSACILVVDGDLQVGSQLRNSLIIARGNVSARTIFRNSAIVASGKVDSVPFRHNETDSTIIQNCPKPLDFVRWFEPSTVGMEVAAAKDGMHVWKVRPKSPSDKAGLRS